MKRRVITAAEYDVICARRHYYYLQRAGATDSIKRQIRRRERREGHEEVRKEAAWSRSY